MRINIMLIAKFLAVAGATLFLTSCAASMHRCPTSDLLLDATLFPDGSQVGGLTSPMPGGTADSAGLTIYMGQGIANHDVYPFSTQRRAAVEFGQRQRDPAFSSQANTGWGIPQELSYRSLVADQYRVACGQDHSIYMCIMIAQYENYFVFFNVHVRSGEMTVAQVNGIFRAIDERMSRCLEKPLPAQSSVQ